MTSFGSFQQADPGGLHQPHWSFNVLNHCTLQSCCDYTQLHCCAQLYTSGAAAAWATGTFNTVAAITAGSCYTWAANSTCKEGINIFGVRAPGVAAAAASSAAVCTATAPAALSVATDRESTGALRHEHNPSSSLNSPPRSPWQSVETDVAGAEADSQSRSGCRDASYPVISALGAFSSSAAAVCLCASGLGCVWSPLLLHPNGAAASQVLQAASLSLAVSACTAHSFSDSAPVSVYTHTSFSSVTPLIYFPSITPRSPTICLCITALISCVQTMHDMDSLCWLLAF